MATENVQMTAEERAEFEAFKAEKEKKRREEERREQRRQYAGMVDDEISVTIPQLRELSEQIKLVKETVFGNFEAILRMKSEMTGWRRVTARTATRSPTPTAPCG